MPPPKVIPEALHGEVLARAGRGETGEQIAAATRTDPDKEPMPLQRPPRMRPPAHPEKT